MKFLEERQTATTDSLRTRGTGKAFSLSYTDAAHHRGVRVAHRRRLTLPQGRKLKFAFTTPHQSRIFEADLH
eukprot:6749315-Heterocapsa_arctica.AAC.1